MIIDASTGRSRPPAPCPTWATTTPLSGWATAAAWSSRARSTTPGRHQGVVVRPAGALFVGGIGGGQAVRGSRALSRPLPGRPQRQVGPLRRRGGRGRASLTSAIAIVRAGGEWGEVAPPRGQGRRSFEWRVDRQAKPKPLVPPDDPAPKAKAEFGTSPSSWTTSKPRPFQFALRQPRGRTGHHEQARRREGQLVDCSASPGLAKADRPPAAARGPQPAGLQPRRQEGPAGRAAAAGCRHVLVGLDRRVLASVRRGDRPGWGAGLRGLRRRHARADAQQGRHARAVVAALVQRREFVKPVRPLAVALGGGRKMLAWCDGERFPPAGRPQGQVAGPVRPAKPCRTPASTAWRFPPTA